MTAIELKLALPDELAREAEAAGLLTSEAIAALLRAEVRRRRAERFIATAERLSATGQPLTDAEVEAEIAAARVKKSGDGDAGRT